MKKKSKGFTLIELIMTLAITTLIIGVVYAFFNVSNRTLTTTELNSQLQDDARLIQEVLVLIGTDGTGINEIIDESGNTIEKYTDFFTAQNINNNERLNLTSIKLNLEDGSICTLEYDSTTRILSSTIGSGVKEILSKNVESFSIRPLDIRMIDLSTDPLFADATGVEFNISLNKEKGYSEVDYPISVITKFRNQ